MAIHAQHKPALSWITSGSPFLKPQPGNAIWLCRTSVNPLKAPDPSECFPSPLLLGQAESASIPGSMYPAALQCSLPGKRLLQREPGRWSVEDVLLARLSQPSESLFSRLRVFFQYLRTREPSWERAWACLSFNHLHSWAGQGGDIKLGCSLTKGDQAPSWKRKLFGVEKNSSLSLSNLKPREGESPGTGKPPDRVQVLKPLSSPNQLA